MTQTDHEFVEACGFEADSPVGDMVIVLRNQLAEFGSVQSESICANVRIVDTGTIHSADSIDLAVFTVLLEDLIGMQLRPDTYERVFGSGAENMQVRDWVRLVIEQRAESSPVQQGGSTVPAKEGREHHVM